MATSAERLQILRGRVFTGAWTLYAGYYVCRKNVGSTGGQAVSEFAATLACFAITYAIGQIVGGILADRGYARRVALFGALFSVLCTGLMAWGARPHLALLLQLGNGFGQGVGWPSIMKLIGCWFRRSERDRVLGWWSSSYILGGLLATSLTAWLVVHTGVTSGSGFYPAYLVSSGVLLCAAVFFYRETYDLHSAGSIPDEPAGDGAAGRDTSGSWRGILANRSIWISSGAYFFLKMTRYTLLFWLPHYLISSLGYTTRAAEHVASDFELFGFLGPLAVGYAMQRWFSSKHMPLGAGILFGLAFLCLLHPVLALDGWFAISASIALMGILIYGADILISGMAVLDAVPHAMHGRATGVVNAIGSIGQTLSPFLVTVFVSHLGWTELFDLFVFFAIVAGIICAIGARQAQQTLPLNRSVLEPSKQAF
jgi:sugar phosphate permease